MKLDRRGETDWMKDSAPNFHPRNEAKILLAGVAFEPLVGEAIAMVLVVRERFQEAFKALKQTIAEPYSPQNSSQRRNPTNI